MNFDAMLRRRYELKVIEKKRICVELSRIEME